VGLSSISREVLDHYDPVENLFATIQCNLLDRNMHNQHGVLAPVRRNEQNYGAFQIVSKKTSMILRCVSKLNYFLELWNTSQAKFNNIIIEFPEIQVKFIKYLSLVLVFELGTSIRLYVAETNEL
jgi:hypothetical protein